MTHARQTVGLSLAGLIAIVTFFVVDRDAPGPVVTVQEPALIRRSPRTMPVPSVAPGVNATGAGASEPACRGSSPGPSWSCQAGVWQLFPPPPPAATVGGRINRAEGCLSEQPAPSLVCRNGSWIQAETATSEPAIGPRPAPSDSPSPPQSEPRRNEEPPPAGDAASPSPVESQPLPTLP